MSVYQKAIFKPYFEGKNEALVPNLLDRQFNQQKLLEAFLCSCWQSLGLCLLDY